ncbi:FAD-dependent monooxygenase [Granulosicoccus sp.]|nr:FAD-dependent monooxygenase [Granulosicoccus sp.]MDB4223853.1 FAD-dependent monooxygenase [Granulosicoccus sp.]
MQTNIAIIGGGLGGLATALFLRQAGFNATVYEAVSELREVGAGIVVPPNMVRLLERLGLSDSLKRTAVELEAAWEFRRWQDGRILSSQPMGERCVELYGTHCYVAHRADLMNMLKAAIPPEQLKLGHRCTSIQAVANGVELEFTTQAGAKVNVHADAVIGADGIHSVVRPTVVPADEARYSGLCAFRCLVPADAAPEMALRPVQTLWLGPNKHFVHYPISGGQYVNIVAIVPAGDWRSESWTEDGDVGDLMREFDGWDPRLHDMILAATDTKRWALYDRLPLARWSNNRVTLLGDAAHAMMPLFAQGAAQAIEDAAVLAQCFSIHVQDKNAASVTEALKQYEAIRQPRASEVQTMSRGREIRNHFPDGPEQVQRDEELARGDPLKQSAWLYGYDALNR